MAFAINGLTGLRLGHDKSPLPLSYRREQVYHTARQVVVAIAGKGKLLIREKRGQKVERHPVPDILRSTSVDSMYLDQREILVSLAGRTDLAYNGVACLQSVGLDLILRHIDVIRGVEIVVVRRAEEPVTVGHDLQHTLSLYDTVILRLFRFGSRLLHRGGQLLRCLMLRQLMSGALMRRELSLLLPGLLGLRTLLSLSLSLRFRSCGCLLSLFGRILS